MKITLYKRCLISDDYNEVFDNKIKDSAGKTALDRYLSGLVKYTIPAEQTTDMIYLTGSGSFTFELSIPTIYNTIYEFNYMKCESDDGKLVRFCFIDNIDIGNSVAVIYYTEDIWHSYMSTMQIRDSLLVNSRVLNYVGLDIKWRTLVDEYDSNNQIDLLPLLNLGVNREVYIFAQLQIYQLGTNGEVTSRQPYSVIFDTQQKTEEYKINPIQLFGELNAQNFIKELVIKSSSADKQFRLGNSATPDYFFQVDNFLFINKEYINNISVDSTKAIGTVGWGSNEVRVYNTEKVFGNIAAIFSKRIENNYKNMAIGFFSKDYEFQSNGTSVPVTINLVCNEFTTNVFLSYQNKVIDITDDFTVEVPIEAITSDVNAQRRMAKFMKIATGITDIVTGISYGEVANQYKKIKGTHRKIRGEEYKPAQLQSIKRGRIASSISELEASNRSSISIVNGVLDIATATAPIYSSNKGTFAFSDGVINAQFGLVLKQITPDNEKYINNIIDNCGYNVREFVNNEILRPVFSDTDKKFNILGFDFVKLYGNFPANIAEALKDILRKGIKIWYTENV